MTITFSEACQTFSVPKPTLHRRLTQAGVDPVHRGTLGAAGRNPSVYLLSDVERVMRPPKKVLFAIKDLQGMCPGFSRATIKNRLRKVQPNAHGDHGQRLWTLRAAMAVLSAPLVAGESPILRALIAEAQEAFLEDVGYAIAMAEAASAIIAGTFEDEQDDDAA